MFTNSHYHATIRKSIALFGSLFNNISISRADSSGENIETFKIPVAYGPREKFLARLESDPALNRPQAISLPRIAFELKSLSYDNSRKIGSNQKIVFPTANTSIHKVIYAEVPYILKFSMNIMVKEAEDGTKIIEQILPFFTPDHTLSVKMLDEFPDMIIDIPIVLNSVSNQDDYTGSFLERRALIWDLEFTMKVKFYGPTFKSKVIKIVQINTYSESDTEQKIQSLTIQPGLDVDGNPTSFANSTISPLLISEDDNFGYVITTEEFPNV